MNKHILHDYCCHIMAWHEVCDACSLSSHCRFCELAFACMKPWCAYHILQYAYPNCKTILVQERSTSNCILCQQLCLWNHYVFFFPFCCFMHVGSDWVGCRHWVSKSYFETYGKRGCATNLDHCFGLLE